MCISLYCVLCSYFETYGCIPELNDDHSDEKFTAMRIVSDVSTVHKGDNTLCVYWSLYYCNCVLQRLVVLGRNCQLICWNLFYFFTYKMLHVFLSSHPLSMTSILYNIHILWPVLVQHTYAYTYRVPTLQQTNV